MAPEMNRGCVSMLSSAEMQLMSWRSHLTAEELSRVIPAQRDHLEQQVDASAQIPAEQPAQDHALRTVKLPLPRHRSLIGDRCQHPCRPRARGRWVCYLMQRKNRLEKPSPAAVERATAPIPRHAVQMGLFGEQQPTASASHTVVAQSYPAAAKEVRGVVDDTADTNALDDWDVPNGFVPPKPYKYVPVQFEDLKDHERSQLKAIEEEFDFLWDGATWGQAIAMYEDRRLCTISRNLYDYLTAQDPKAPEHELAPASTVEEIQRWEANLSGGEERDMLDRLDNGGMGGESTPSERAVLGRFTRLVGQSKSVAQIVHEAIEHYEPWGTMVERIERETGVSAADDRGTRSLYNATLADRSGWDR